MGNSINAAQHVFLNELKTKYRAYVGGYGCVSATTKIHTEFGLMRICDINRPMRVLSWNERDQKFQLSLSGGSFPKGRANLYQVSTRLGLSELSAHHRLLSSCGKYVRADSLRAGDGLSSFCADLPSSSLGLDQLLCSLDAQRYSEKHADSMRRYADAARLYGQRFLEAQDNDLIHAQQPIDAQVLGRSCDPFESLRMGGQPEQKQSHIHHDQSCDQKHTKDYFCQLLRRLVGAANRIFSSFSVRIFGYHRKARLFLSRFLNHRNSEQHFFDGHSFSSTPVLSVVMGKEQPYYDMQVLNTNNYVCENGLIHHNSGKTYVGCLDLLNFAAAHPKVTQGYFAPTYPQIRDIFYPTIDEAAFNLGFDTDIKTGDKEVTISRNGRYYGTIICRSMDNPRTIVGFKIARALVDEIDTLTKDKAKDAWMKIIARLRLKIDGVVNGVGVTTTPEGFLFVYERFKKDPTESYSMVQASTYENEEYLPDDYIKTLLESYPEKVAQAYINGEFVNFTSGTVYYNYDRKLNNSFRKVEQGDILYIGMDFNVGQMAAIVHVKDEIGAIAVDEITDAFDTPDMINQIRLKYPKHKIRVYPDSSGKGRQTVEASKSDISLLEEAGFSVIYESQNPRVRDRVLCMNAQFLTSEGVRAYRVNCLTCPTYADNLEQQVWDASGAPDKKSGTDHTNDAGGYFISLEYRIQKPVANLNINFSR